MKKLKASLFLLILLVSVVHAQDTTEYIQALEQIVQHDEIVALSQEYELPIPYPLLGLVQLRNDPALALLRDKMRLVDAEEIFFQRQAHVRFASLIQQGQRMQAAFSIVGVDAAFAAERADLDREHSVAVNMMLERQGDSWVVTDLTVEE